MKNRCLLILVLIFLTGCKKEINRGGVYKNTLENYGKEIEFIAYQNELPASYLKALIALECSGRKNAPSRLEKHVFRKLKRVRDGKRRRYEQIYKADILDASDEALENLSRSWGPFQLMGYKCLQLGINVADVRGDDALFWGVKWINLEYGDLLREGRFEEAFRFHNSGSKKGKTADPNYVKNGLKYMLYFDNL